MSITLERMNLDLIKEATLEGIYEFPICKPTEKIPTQLTSFNYIKSQGATNYIHHFIDDYQFERVWKFPRKYLEVFKQFDGIIGTDFSCWLDMPFPVQLYSIYKNRLLDYFFSNNGVDLIPVVTWSDEDSFAWCFDGIPKNSNVALSTNGCRRNDEAKMWFQYGYEIMKDILQPKTIVCYGEPFDFMKADNVIAFENKQLKHFKEIK